MRKNLLALVLCSFIVLGVSACGGSNDMSSSAESSSAETSSNTSSQSSNSSDQNSSDNAVKVAVCLPSHVQFFTTAESGIIDYATENNIDIDVFDANSDISTQIAQVETAANNNYDAIVVALVQNNSAAEIKDAAGDLPVAFFNIFPTDSTVLDETHVYVGMLEKEAGIAQGEYLAQLLDEQGSPKDINGVMMLGPIGLDPTNERTAGAKEALESAGYNVTWVFEDTADWDRAKAMDKFTQFQGTGQSYDIIVANADDLALGIIEAMTASGIDPTAVPIVGVDATETGCNAILDGSMAMTVNQDPRNQGATALEYAVALVNGTEIDIDENYCYWTEAEVVTTENAEEILALYRD